MSAILSVFLISRELEPGTVLSTGEKFGNLIYQCTMSRFFTFVHEFGHALPLICAGREAKIEVFNNLTQDGVAGLCYDMSGQKMSHSLRWIHTLGGPVFNALVSSCLFSYSFYKIFSQKEVGAIKTTGYGLLGINSAISLSNELAYALSSSAEFFEQGSSNGDFGRIAAMGGLEFAGSWMLLATAATVPLVIAGAALITKWTKQEAHRQINAQRELQVPHSL